MSTLLVRVEKYIRKHPGVAMVQLKKVFKTDSTAISNTVSRLKKIRGLNVESQISGVHKERTVSYTIVGNKSEKTASEPIVKNISIKPRGISDDNSVLATFSDSDRAQYFSFLEKAAFYHASANLIISARKERISKERMAFKV